MQNVNAKASKKDLQIHFESASVKKSERLHTGDLQYSGVPIHSEFRALVSEKEEDFGLGKSKECGDHSRSWIPWDVDDGSQPGIRGQTSLRRSQRANENR